MPRLWMFGPESPTPFELTEEAGLLMIGRKDKNPIWVNDPKVSGRHALVGFEDGEWLIRDLDSSNGTWVDGRRVATSNLKSGTRIVVGDTLLMFDADHLVEEGGVDFETNVEKAVRMTVDVLSFEEAESAKGNETASLSKRKLRLKQVLDEKLVRFSDIEQIANEFLTLVVEETQTDFGMVCLFDKDNSYVPLARVGYASAEKATVSRSILDRMLKRKSGVLISTRDHGSIQSMASKQVGSTLCVPLWTSDQIMGFVSLDRKIDKDPFEWGHLELVISLAHQAAIGLERARLSQIAAADQGVRDYLSKYLDAKLIDVLGRAADGEDPLAPAEREVTIMFADIVSFTKLSEGLPPNELADFVRSFLTEITGVIFRHGGTIDKYIGDAVMALFGAPIPSTNSASDAVKAALDLVEHVRDIPTPPTIKTNLRLSIGIATGNVIVGNIGSEQRVEYTAIGDPVNVASRLESFARPNEICIDGNTHDKCGESFAVQEIGVIDVRNRHQPVEVFKVLGEVADTELGGMATMPDEFDIGQSTIPD